MQHFIRTYKLQKIITSFIVVILTMTILMPSSVFADEVTDFISSTIGNSTTVSMDRIADTIRNTQGVNSLQIENNKLVIKGSVTKGTLKDNLNRIIAEDATDTLIDLYVEIQQEEEEGVDNTQPKTEKEQFADILKRKYTDISDSTIEQYWIWHDDENIQGAHGGLAVKTEKDANGNITDVIVDLDSQQMTASGTAGTSTEQEILDENNESSEDDSTLFGLLFSPFVSLIVGITDGVNWILQEAIIGNSGSVTVLRDNAVNYMNQNDATGQSDLPIVNVIKSGVDHSAGGIFGTSLGFGTTYRIGVVKLTSAEIFAGRVAALNANFFKTDTDTDSLLGGTEKSIVNSLRGVVSSWYVAIRNIAIVGLLSVLIYIGIRIIISSSANDKAKYKQFFEDWLIALCLIFFMHYIMSFTMAISDQVTNMIANSDNALNSDGSIRQCIINIESDGTNGPTRTYYSNFTNIARLKLQYDNLPAKLGYTVIYVALTAYTVYFTIVYLKRLLMLAFYTLMAPAVALTYPLDKMKDGKAQAFDFWLKDYIFYAMLQPLHMILYTVFVSSAIELAANNMIYAIVAIAFIVPAEKIVKTMFGIKGNTENRVGGFAGGAVAGTLFSNLRNMQKQPKQGGKGGASAQNDKIPTFKNQSPPDNFDVMREQAATLDSAVVGGAAGIAGGIANGAEGNNRAGRNTNNQEQQNPPQYSPDLDADQIEYLRSEGIQPGDQRYNQYLAENGIDNTPPQTQNSAQVQNTATPIRRMQQGQTNPQQTHRQVANIPATRRGRFARYVNRRVTDAGGWGRVAGNVAKGALKGYATVGTAMAMGAAGLGIGAVGGDLGDLGKGLAAGTTAGAFIGNNLGERATRGIDFLADTAKGNNELGRFKEEVWDGASIDEMNRKQYVSAYSDSKENRRRLLEKHPEYYDKSNQEIKERLQQEADMSFDTGITDYKTINKALKLEDKYKDAGRDKKTAHNLALSTAQLSENYSNSIFADNKKLQAAKDSFVDRLLEKKNEDGTSVITEAQARQQAEEVFENIRTIKGL